MGKPASSKEIDRLQTVSRDIASETLKGAQAAGQFKRFPDSALAAADPRFSGITSFLPQGMRSSIPTQYQGMQGQMYANYQTPQKLGAGLTAFGMTPGQTTPIQTGGIGSVSTPLTPPAEDETPIDVGQDTLDQIVAEIRQDLDMPVMGSYEDMVPKPIPKPPKGNIGRQQRIKRENAAALKKWEEGKKEFEAATNQFRYGGIAMLSKGGEMDFPRMNGPISGPGTETSDDIPAMLSDGEFVVNAKGVSGVGKLGGANKSKTDQRKEGARMMYALQRAGEQAMRGAS